MSQNIDIVCVESHPLLEAIVAEILTTIAPSASIDCRNDLGLLKNGELACQVLVLGMPTVDIETFSVLFSLHSQGRFKSLILHSLESESEAMSLSREQWIHPVLRKTRVKDFFNELEVVLKREGVLSSLAPMSRQRNQYQSDLLSLDGNKPLTKRQVEILDLLAQGFSAKEVARLLGLSPETVRGHVKDVFARLGVRNIAQAIEVYSKAKRLTGIVDVER